MRLALKPEAKAAAAKRIGGDVAVRSWDNGVASARSTLGVCCSREGGGLWPFRVPLATPRGLPKRGPTRPGSRPAAPALAHPLSRFPSARCSHAGRHNPQDDGGGHPEARGVTCRPVSFNPPPLASLAVPGRLFKAARRPAALRVLPPRSGGNSTRVYSEVMRDGAGPVFEPPLDSGFAQGWRLSSAAATGVTLRTELLLPLVSAARGASCSYSRERVGPARFDLAARSAAGAPVRRDCQWPHACNPSRVQHTGQPVSSSVARSAASGTPGGGNTEASRTREPISNRDVQSRGICLFHPSVAVGRNTKVSTHVTLLYPPACVWASGDTRIHTYTHTHTRSLLPPSAFLSPSFSRHCLRD